MLNREPNTTMQEVTTKIQEQVGLQLSQVSLSMVKNSCKCGHGLTHYLLEDTSEFGTIIRTGITCKKIPCYTRDSACRWLIVKKAKIF